MKIINNSLNYDVFSKYHDINKFQKNTVNFGMRINYGIPAKLSSTLSEKVQDIYKKIDMIQNFYLEYKNNPQRVALIRNKYPDIIQKRSAGIIFKLPDTENTLEVMKSITRDVLYISINDGRHEYNGIVIDGFDKLIANYPKYHPHMLPTSIKYMNAERMEKANPEYFINMALEKVQRYADYISAIKSGRLPLPKIEMTPSRKAWLEKNKPSKKVKVNDDESSVIEKQVEKKSKRTVAKNSKISKFIEKYPAYRETTVVEQAKLSDEEIEESINTKAKNFLKKITTMLNMSAENFPKHITPKLAPSGKALGFTLKTDDGGSLTVLKKANSNYGSSMPYLSIHKIEPNKTEKYLCIDMITNKVLRTREQGKPHISSDHIVYELTPTELVKRKIESKIDYYMSQIFKEEPVSQEVVDSIKQKAPEETDIKKNTENIMPNTEKVGFDIEKLRTKMQELGKSDGSIAAEEYFKAFKEQFISEIQQKMNDFNEKIKAFLQGI